MKLHNIKKGKLSKGEMTEEFRRDMATLFLKRYEQMELDKVALLEPNNRLYQNKVHLAKENYIQNYLAIDKSTFNIEEINILQVNRDNYIMIENIYDILEHMMYLHRQEGTLTKTYLVKEGINKLLLPKINTVILRTNGLTAGIKKGTIIKSKYLSRSILEIIKQDKTPKVVSWRVINEKDEHTILNKKSDVSDLEENIEVNNIITIYGMGVGKPLIRYIIKKEDKEHYVIANVFKNI